MNFENSQVEIEQLPKAEDLSFIPLDRRYFNITLINVMIFNLIFIISILAVLQFQFNWQPQWLVILLLGGGGGLVILITILEIFGFYRKSYALRERDIIYRTGLIWKKLIAVPFNRVQHCEVLQGPIEKMFDLGKLKVFTAGGSGSDLTIPGIILEEAHQLRTYILHKTTVDEEE